MLQTGEMSRPVRPDSLRLGINRSWSSKWLYKKPLKFFLEEDCLIRSIINKQLSSAGVAGVDIERTRKDINVYIKSSRPGLIIGRRGRGIEDLKDSLVKKMAGLRKEKKFDSNFHLNLNVVEIQRGEVSACVLASQIAMDIERRMPFRTVLKRQIRTLKQVRSVKGAKIRVSGRLNGSEIARSEWLSFGRMPLNNLRANIDYGEATAFTTWGTIGVKIWLYKGEIFEE